MEQEQLLFEQIRNEMVSLYRDVTIGVMMSSPAIKYKGKVFTFLSKNNRMVFKLGKTFIPGEQEFETYPFNPFKKKAPLAGWFEVPYSEHHLWKDLAGEALTLIES